MARSVIKIDKNGIPDAAKSVILADIRRFLRNDCEYFWEEKGQYVKAHEGQWLCEGYDGKWTVTDEPPAL